MCELGGLNRYDGNEFKVYQHDLQNPRSISHNYIWTLFEDRNGTLWVGTNGGGLNKYNRETDTFDVYRHDPKAPNSIAHDNVKIIFEDRSGVMWVGSDGGLSKFDPPSGQFLNYRHDPVNPKSLSANSVRSIVENRDTGLLWIGTHRGGISILDRKTDTFTSYKHDPNDPTSLSHNTVLQIFEDRAGTYWFSTYGGGLNRLDPKTNTFIRYQHKQNDPDSLIEDHVSMVHEDSAGRMWAITFDGLELLDRETGKFTHYQHDSVNPGSLSDSKLRAIYEDNTGAIWVGTMSGGVSRLASGPSRFVTYRHTPENPESLSNNAVQRLYVDRSGFVWVGTAGGLNRFDGRKFTRYVHDPDDLTSLSANDVRAISEDINGNFWVGTEGGGLNRFDGKKFIRYQFNPRNPRSIGSNDVDAIFPSAAGGLWISADGLDYFDGRDFTHHDAMKISPESFPRREIDINDIIEDSQGILWLATTSMGVVRFDPKKPAFTPYPVDPEHLDSEATNRVHAIHADGSGHLWVGASSGLFRFDVPTRNFTRQYTKRDGLPGDVVLSILGDDGGNLWIGTTSGLSKFDPQKDTFRNYDRTDGLQANQFVWRSAVKAPDGQLLFGGVRGFNAFYPNRLNDNTQVPPIVLTGFELFNKPVEIGGEGSPLQRAINVSDAITLGPDQTVFSIRFAALNYNAPAKNRYAYKLEGFDADWSYTGAGRQFVTYTNLDAGTYLFRVRGSNNDGVWNETGRSLKITITPPWWRTWWFRTLAALAAIGVFLIGFRGRIRNISERERRFRTLAEHAPDVVARLDRDLRFRYINPAVETHTGLKPDAFVGKTTTELGLPVEGARMWDEWMRQVFQTRQPAVREYDYATPAGERSFESHLVPELTAGGLIESVLVITRDITERKRAQEATRSSLREKEVLLRELHHRVKNNLQVISSLLNLQAGYVTGRPAFEMFRESQNRVRSMALVHERLYRSKDLARLDFHEYISSLAAYLLRSYGSVVGHIDLKLDVANVRLNVDTAIPCGLIINELISNSLKHAFPNGENGKIYVEMHANGDNRYTLSVRDDGVGLPPGLDVRNTESLGLQLVNTLTEQLTGVIEVEEGPGAAFKITFEELKYPERV